MTTFVRKRSGADGTKWHVANNIGAPPKEPGIFTATTCSSRRTFFPHFTHIPEDLAAILVNPGTAIRPGDEMCSTCAINCQDDVVPELFVKLGGIDPRPKEPVRPVAGVWVTANRNIAGFPMTIHFRVHDRDGWVPSARDNFMQEVAETIRPILELLANKHNVSVRDIR